MSTIARVKTITETPAKLVLKIKRPLWQIFPLLVPLALGLAFIVPSFQGGSWAQLECIRRDAERIDCELQSGRFGVTLSKESLQGLRSVTTRSLIGDTTRVLLVADSGEVDFTVVAGQFVDGQYFIIDREINEFIEDLTPERNFNFQPKTAMLIPFLLGLLAFHVGLLGLTDVIAEVVTVDLDKVRKTWRMEKRSIFFPRVFEHRLDELEAAVVETHKLSDTTDTYRVGMLLKSGRFLPIFGPLFEYTSNRERKQAIADRINGFLEDNRS